MRSASDPSQEWPTLREYLADPIEKRGRCEGLTQKVYVVCRKSIESAQFGTGLSGDKDRTNAWIARNQRPD